MLTARYMTSVKNLPDILKKIREGTAPDKFNVAHLKGLGFKSSNDRGVIPLLKDLGFLTEDGTPTDRYHEFRDHSKSAKILGEALLEAYEELFHVTERPTPQDRKALEGKFKSTHNVSDRVASEQAKTFFALLDLADLEAASEGEEEDLAQKIKSTSEAEQPEAKGRKKITTGSGIPNLRYNIEIHLPPTKDVEVYNAIFKAVKEHLLD